jgi:hypothetical protein
MRTPTLVLMGLFGLATLAACKKDEAAAKAPAPTAPLAPPAAAGQRIEVKVTKVEPKTFETQYTFKSVS